MKQELAQEQEVPHSAGPAFKPTTTRAAFASDGELVQPSPGCRIPTVGCLDAMEQGDSRLVGAAAGLLREASSTPLAATAATSLPKVASLPKIASLQDMAADPATDWEQLSTEQVLSLIDNCMFRSPHATQTALMPLDELEPETTSDSETVPMTGIPLQRTGCSGGFESLEL